MGIQFVGTLACMSGLGHIHVSLLCTYSPVKGRELAGSSQCSGVSFWRLDLCTEWEMELSKFH